MISDSGVDNISMIFLCQYYMSEGVNFSRNSVSECEIVKEVMREGEDAVIGKYDNRVFGCERVYGQIHVNALLHLGSFE